MTTLMGIQFGLHHGLKCDSMMEINDSDIDYIYFKRPHAVLITNLCGAYLNPASQ